MKRFHLKADAYFMAKNLGDAFFKLEEHFKRLHEDGSEEPVILLPESDISLSVDGEPKFMETATNDR